MHILHMSGGYIGHRSGWRPSLSMPWSLLPASPSSAFLSKCGVASVTVSNVAAEGERRRNLRQFESSTRGGFSRRGRFQATDPSCAVNSVTLTEEVRRRRFESSTKRRTSQCGSVSETVPDVVTEEVRMRIIMRWFETSKEDFDMTLKMSKKKLQLNVMKHSVPNVVREVVRIIMRWFESSIRG